MNFFDRAMQHTWVRWLWLLSFTAIGLYVLFGGQPSTSQTPIQTSSASLEMRRSNDLQISDSFSIGQKTIESLRVGDRVLAENPQVTAEERAAYIEPNWNDWLHISLSLSKPDGSQLDIEMLRTEEWFIEQCSLLVQPKEEPNNDQQNSEGIKPQTSGLTFPTLPEFNLIHAGGFETELSISEVAQQTDFESTTGVPWRPAYAELFRRHALAESEGQEPLGLLVQMDLPEMGLTGEAVVTNIQPAPAVRSGNGRVVTATFKHSSGDCIDLVVADSDTKETLGTTSNHPFWSVDRQDYVQAGSLHLDERVQTYSGDTKRVISKLPRPGPEAVYNLEVHGEHVYYVGVNGVLVHNTEDYAGSLDSLLAARTPPRSVEGLATARVDRFNRAGYQNYRLETNIGTADNPVWQVYYHGYIAPGVKPSAITRRHSLNVGPDQRVRFNPETDRIVMEPGTRLYGEARLMEHRGIIQDNTFIGRLNTSKSRRGNNQNGIDPAKLREYEAWERALKSQ